MRRALGFGLAALLAACGLSVAGVLDEGAPADPTTDGAPSLPDGANEDEIPDAAEEAVSLADASDDVGAIVLDGSADAADGGCLSNPVRAPLNDPRWVLAGSASLVGGGAVRLTPFMASRAGAIEWNQTRSISTFDARFEFRVGKQSTFSDPADGLVFVWATGVGIPVIGDNGSNFGACKGGLTGYGVVIDTYPTDAYVRLIRLPSCQVLDSTLLVSLADGAYRPLRVQLGANGQVRVTSGGSPLLTDTIQGYTPFVGFVGFTAATGAEVAEYSVRNVEIAFLNEPACP